MKTFEINSVFPECRTSNLLVQNTIKTDDKNMCSLYLNITDQKLLNQVMTYYQENNKSPNLRIFTKGMDGKADIKAKGRLFVNDYEPNKHNAGSDFDL